MSSNTKGLCLVNVTVRGKGFRVLILQRDYTLSTLKGFWMEDVRGDKQPTDR